MFIQQRDGDRAGVRITPIQRAAPDTGGLGDVVHRDGARVATGEQLGGGGEDLRPVARRICPLALAVHPVTVIDLRNKWTQCPVNLGMTSLLHLDTSARRRSISRQVGAAFAGTWRETHPDGRYVYRDLATDPVPFIDEGWTQLCDAVLAAGRADLDRLADLVCTAEHEQAWAVVEPLLTELRSADVVLIGTPMYNYSIPAALKAWLDQVTFPKMSLAPMRFVVATARGGAYSPGAPRAAFDYQERYLRDFFAGHFGITDTVFINAELANSRQDPSLAHLRDEHDRSHALALETARRLAKGY